MTDAPIRTYGLHLMIDGYGADRRKLADVALVFETLDALPSILGMRKIGFPQIARFTDPDIAGVSGIVMIYESHISLHTYANKGFLSLDAYSCKPFDHEKVIAYIEDAFGVRDQEVQLIERGKRFPIGNVH